MPNRARPTSKPVAKFIDAWAKRCPKHYEAFVAALLLSPDLTEAFERDDGIGCYNAVRAVTYRIYKDKPPKTLKDALLALLKSLN